MTKMRVLVTQNTKINIGESLFKNDVFAKISQNFLAISVLHFISSYLCPFFLKLVTHTHVHTGTVPPCLTQNLAPNQKNSLDYILCLVSPSQLPTAVLFWSCWQVSGFAALVRASVVGLLLPYLVPCRRDNQDPDTSFFLFILKVLWLVKFNCVIEFQILKVSG